MLKVAFFATASRFSLLALEELAAHHQVVAAVIAEPKAPGLRTSLLRLASLEAQSPLSSAARTLQIPVIAGKAGGEAEVADRLRKLQPDIVCIAIYPWRVAPEIVELAPVGAINLHPSLLPRHRGPLPIFWTYFANDAAAGVTVHHASEKLDAGDIILQDSMPLARGYPAVKLDEDLAVHGSALLRKAVGELQAGRAPRVAQDERAATYAPRVKPGTPMVRFDEWDVERVWHFLSALCPRFREPLADESGRAILYQSVAGFERGPAGAPGSVEKAGNGWKLYCRDGAVFLQA